jgi:hypothetical protein
MQPLKLHVKPAGTVEGIRANVQAALARNLPEMAPGIVAHDGTMVVVGSGPSMPEHVEEIRAERELGRPIFAVKGAHDFLCQHGMQPDLWLCVDPRDRAYLLQEANDHTWAKEEHCEEYNGKLLIGGGTTSGLRAITVSYVLGFRKIVLYGFDSCLAKDKFTKRFTGEGVEPGKLIDVIVDGKRFWCNGAMAQQANEFQQYYEAMPDVKIEAKGDGLLAAIIAARHKRGFPA